MSRDRDLAVGESLVVDDEGDLTVETTRTAEHLFTTTYTDPETGDVRLALQVDVTTGRTAIDPRRIDPSFWTLVAEGDEWAVDDLEQVIRRVPNPGIEVKPDRREIHVYTEDE